MSQSTSDCDKGYLAKVYCEKVSQIMIIQVKLGRTINKPPTWCYSSHFCHKMAPQLGAPIGGATYCPPYVNDRELPIVSFADRGVNPVAGGCAIEQQLEEIANVA